MTAYLVILWNLLSKQVEWISTKKWIINFDKKNKQIEGSMCWKSRNGKYGFTIDYCSHEINR